MPATPAEPARRRRKAPAGKTTRAAAGVPAGAAAADGAAPVPDGARASDVSAALYVAPSALHGLGMFAADALDADVVLGRLAGMPTYEDGTYVLWLTDELGLEVTNDFRFINHSATPNCALTEVDVVTLRPVAPGEELTHDYGWPS